MMGASDFRKPFISKTACHRAKRSEIWTSVCVFGVYRVLLTVKCLRSFWGYSVHFRFRKHCVSKTAGRRAKRSEIWASSGGGRGVSIQCIHGTFGI